MVIGHEAIHGRRPDPRRQLVGVPGRPHLVDDGEALARRPPCPRGGPVLEQCRVALQDSGPNGQLGLVDARLRHHYTNLASVGSGCWYFQ